MNSRAESVDAKDIESPRNRDTANEELSTMTEYLTKLKLTCALSRPSSTTFATQSIVLKPWARESWMECRLSWVGKVKNQGKHDARDADVVFGVR